MTAEGTRPRRFRAALAGSEKTRVYLPLPFDVAKAWGPRDRYHVRGTIDGERIRGPLVEWAQGHFLSLGPGYCRNRGRKVGDTVDVVLGLEGPQREALAPDIAVALDAEPEAGRFFEALATFYRKGYLRWIDATKRRPDVRAARIAELVELLKAGRKER